MVNATSPNSVRLSLKSWIILVVAFGLMIWGIWESIKPFLAEWYYREGFNQSVYAEQYLNAKRTDVAYKRYGFAVQSLEKSVSYATWETQYQSELGKAMEGMANAAPNPQTKVAILKSIIPLYERNIELDWQNPWFYNRLGTIYSQLIPLLDDPAEQDAAIATFDSLIKQSALADPKNPLFQLNYAFYLHRNNRVDEAIPYYKLTLSYDDRMIDAATNLGDIYSLRKDYAQAAPYYELAYQKSPDTPKLRYKLAAVYMQMGEPDKAIPILRDAYIQTPFDRELAQNYVAILHEARRWKEAIEVYESMIEMFPDMKDLHTYYIQALVNSGQLTKATVKLNAYIKAHPNDPTPKDQLRKIQAFIKQASQ